MYGVVSVLRGLAQVLSWKISSRRSTTVSISSYKICMSTSITSSSSTPMTLFNPAQDPRNTSSKPSTLDHQASKQSEDGDWAGEPFDDLDDQAAGTPRVLRKRAKGWKEVLTDSSNLISNVNWDLTFWRATNASETMHILVIKKDDSRGVAAIGDLE